MKLKEYVENLNKLLETNPESAEYEVVYARDDEGNGFRGIYFQPSIGNFNGDEYYPEESFEDCFEEGENPVVNAVCIN